MQETIDKMVEFVQSNGGSVGWVELRDHLTPAEQRVMMPAINQAEANGDLLRVIRFVPNVGNSFTVDYVGEETPQEPVAPTGGE